MRKNQSLLHHITQPIISFPLIKSQFKSLKMLFSLNYQSLANEPICEAHLEALCSLAVLQHLCRQGSSLNAVEMHWN